MVWHEGWSGVRIWWLPVRWQMSCEGGEVLGSRRFVLLARERIWTGRRFAINQIVFDWAWCWGGVAWFVRDWGDIVGGRWCWCWGDIGWFVSWHWGHCQLFTCVVDVFVALFVEGHLEVNQIEGGKVNAFWLKQLLTSSTSMYSVSHLERRRIIEGGMRGHNWFQDLYSLACNRRVWSMSIMIEPDVFLLKCVLLSHFKSYRSCMASLLHCCQNQIKFKFQAQVSSSPFFISGFAFLFWNLRCHFLAFLIQLRIRCVITLKNVSHWLPFNYLLP